MQHTENLLVDAPQWLTRRSSKDISPSGDQLPIHALYNDSDSTVELLVLAQHPLPIGAQIAKELWVDNLHHTGRQNDSPTPTLLPRAAHPLPV